MRESALTADRGRHNALVMGINPKLLPGTGRGTGRRLVEGAGRNGYPVWKPPVRPSACHLAFAGEE